MTKEDAVAKLKELGCFIMPSSPPYRGMAVTSPSDCMRKIAYSRAAAGVAKGRLADKGKHMKAYECPHCKQWHLARGVDKNGKAHK